MAADEIYQYNLQDIKRYLSGNMSAQEMHDIERAALTDPFLADAIDGYRNANPAISSKHLNEIAALLQKEKREDTLVVPMRSGTTNWKRWIAAAGVAGILGVAAWLMMNNRDADPTAEIAKLSVPQTTDSVAITPHKENIMPHSGDSVTGLMVGPAQSAPAGISAEVVAGKTKSLPEVAPAVPVMESSSDAQSLAPVKEIPMASREPGLAPAEQNRAEISRNVTVNEPAFKRTSGNEAAKAAAPARQQEFAKASFNGKVTDENGAPLAGASVAMGNAATVTNAQGRFTLTLPMVNDSIDNVYITAAGYKPELATLFAGRTAGIALQADNNLNEVVVVGFGTKKKARLGRMSDLKVEPMEDIQTPYPDGGWDAFYDDLLEDLGMNKEKANKLLHLRFFIENNGKPVNFTVVKTPDMAIANRAIAAIKAGPRWKNYGKKKNAEIKMNVE